MANGNGLSLEVVHRELETLGSLVRNLSTQLASVRVRVSDLETWDAVSGRGDLRLMGKKKGKGKGKNKGKGKGNRNGNGNGMGKVKGRDYGPRKAGR